LMAVTPEQLYELWRITLAYVVLPCRTVVGDGIEMAFMFTVLTAAK